MKIPIHEWVWYGHAGHFICADSCLWHMNTKVGEYIISSVGEMLPTRERIKADRGEAAKFHPVGAAGLYETMVFKATKTPRACGCYDTESGIELACRRYDTHEDATQGHMEFCHMAANGKQWEEY